MTYAYVPAKYQGGDNGVINRIVIHRMQAPEKADTAESVAKYFQHPSSVSSCHLCIDNNSVVECVKPNKIAYHAPPNPHSYGLEHAGYEADGSWTDDAYSNDMLKVSAMASAQFVKDQQKIGNSIPIVWLDVSTLRVNPNARGFTSHDNVSRAFGKSSHWDGRYFPHEAYLAMVRVYLGRPVPPTLPPTQQPPVIYIDAIENEVTMDFQLGPLDDNGNGQWFTDVPMSKFKSVQAISPVRPYADNRYPSGLRPGEAVQCFPAEDKGKVLVSVIGGTPKGYARLFLNAAQ